MIIDFIQKLNFSSIKVLNLNNMINDDNLLNTSNSQKEVCERQSSHISIRKIFYLFTLINFIANFIVVTTIANFQIVNRILTANPIIYVLCSDEVLLYKSNKNNKLGKYILIVFIIYSILGCVMQPGSYGYA